MEVAERPNVLVLMADQLRADLLGVNGSPICRTPHLDRLAAQGVSFSRAYTPTPLCSPARAALFTGRYPHSNGITVNTRPPDSPTPCLHEGERMLFEHLAPAGYRCAYLGKWHLSMGDEGAEATRRGIVDFVSRPQAIRRHAKRLHLAPRDDVGLSRQRTMEGDHPPMSGPAPYPETYHPDAAVASETVELLRRYVADGRGSPERPFALVCSFFGPHFPIEVPQPYASMYDPQLVPRPESFDDSFEGKPQGQRTHHWLQLASHLSWPEWQRVIAHYWGYCTYIDTLMGRVLAAVDELGLAPSTLVHATADHGEMAGHHQMFDKGPYFYEDVMRVPAVWRWPDHIPPRPAPDEALVGHVDTVPTVLQLTGVPALPGSPPLQGDSLARHLTGAGRLDRDYVFGETTDADRALPAINLATVNPQVDARVVIGRRWKYVFRPDDLDELYDLADDPGELRNLAASPAHGAVAQQLQEALAQWMRATGDPFSEHHLSAHGGTR